ncbi:lipopolysaccharide biosynthesis protein [Pseudomonas sp. ABC1]|uniref:lipopolysaccharide biosynthesis protein n=1 Tax=Pseudomonas sp. ABC1 TaxID=2748080 RepID=UPI0015C30033|nr:lipopolysaccharide biosynthesis protein [Pseudomonas sp. ABC1]QLF94492.1 lipopolysaccharide biosynthesis protein [Pseudomonas sp. ABC1]
MTTNLKSKVLKGFGWIFAGTLGQNFLQFLSLIILARLLTPDEFGVVSIALVIVGFLKIFTELGVGPAVVQRLELTKSHIGTANTMAVVLGVAVSFALYLSASKISFFFDMPELENVVRVLSLMLPASSLAVVGQSLLQRNLKFRQIAIYNLLSYVVGYACISIPMALLGCGVWSLVFSQLGQIVAINLIVHFVVKEANYYAFNMESAKELLGYGAGYSLAKVSNFIAGEGDNLIVGKFLGAGALGVYSNAYRLMLFPASLIGGVIDKVLFPILSNIQNDKDRISKVYVDILSLATMLLVPMSIYLYFFANEIIMLVLGSQWGGAVFVFQLLIISLAFRLNYKFSDLLAAALGAVYRRAIRQLIYAFAVVLGAYLGHFFGAEGVAVGVGLAITLNYIIMLQLSQVLIGFSWRDVALMHLKQLWMAVLIIVFTYISKRYIFDGVKSELLLLFLSGLFFVSITLFLWFVFSRIMKRELEICKFILGRVFS